MTDSISWKRLTLWMVSGDQRTIELHLPGGISYYTLSLVHDKPQLQYCELEGFSIQIDLGEKDLAQVVSYMCILGEELVQGIGVGYQISSNRERLESRAILWSTEVPPEVIDFFGGDFLPSYDLI
jgi:hypothetical protein